MAVVVGQRSVTTQHVLLRLEESLQVLWMVTHNLDHVFQSIVVEEGIHEEVVSLENKRDSVIFFNNPSKAIENLMIP